MKNGRQALKNKGKMDMQGIKLYAIWKIQEKMNVRVQGRTIFDDAGKMFGFLDGKNGGKMAKKYMLAGGNCPDFYIGSNIILSNILLYNII